MAAFPREIKNDRRPCKRLLEDLGAGDIAHVKFNFSQFLPTHRTDFLRQNINTHDLRPKAEESATKGGSNEAGGTRDEDPFSRHRGRDF